MAEAARLPRRRAATSPTRKKQDPEPSLCPPSSSTSSSPSAPSHVQIGKHSPTVSTQIETTPVLLTVAMAFALAAFRPFVSPSTARRCSCKVPTSSFWSLVSSPLCTAAHAFPGVVLVARYPPPSAGATSAAGKPCVEFRIVATVGALKASKW